MKKVLSVVIALFVLVSVSICASAAEFSDGTYEVPVVLMHKEDEKESFGNKYVAQTALLEIENGKKTVTILLTTDMKGIEFSYYTNGSLKGDVAKGESVSDVTVAGKTYKQGFKIPIMADGDIGLQFSVPVMPMSPSARLRIDYSKAVEISEAETTVPDIQVTTTVPTVEDTTVLVTEPAASIPETTTAATETSVAETTAPTVQDAYEEATTYAVETPSVDTDEEKNETLASIILAVCSSVAITYMLPVLLAVIFAVILIIVAVSVKRIVKSKKQQQKKKEENNNDDK